MKLQIAAFSFMACISTVVDAAVGGKPMKFAPNWYVDFVNLPSKKHICSGSLITHNIVLTTASCARTLGPSNYARAGKMNFRTGTAYAIEQVITTNYTTYINPDFALVRIKGDSSLVGRVILDLNASYNQVDTQLVRFGRGAIKENLKGRQPKWTYPRKLYAANVYVISYNKCKEFWNDPEIHPGASQFCAIGPDGSGASRGDSGAPIGYGDPNGESYIQTGIVSWTPTYLLPKLPSGYSNVTTGYFWFEKILKKFLQCSPGTTLYTNPNTTLPDCK